MPNLYIHKVKRHCPFVHAKKENDKVDCTLNNVHLRTV